MEEVDVDGDITFEEWLRKLMETMEADRAFYKKLANEAYFVSPNNELYRVFNIKNFSLYLGGQQAYFNKIWQDKEKFRKSMGWIRASDEEIKSFDETIHKTWFHNKLL